MIRYAAGDNIHGDGEASEGGDSGMSMPNFAPTDATGWTGSVVGEKDPILQRPVITEANREYYVVGDWKEATHGDGEATHGDGDDWKATQGDWDPTGTFGILSGNWGSNWRNKKRQTHMLYDAKSTVCAIVVMQEATEEMRLHLMEPGTAGAPRHSDTPLRGSERQWETRPTARFIGLRGSEAGASCMVMGRASIVRGMKLLLFRRRNDGLYKSKGSKKKKMAVTRIFIVACQMRHFRLVTHGGGGADVQEAELVVVNVHLHYATAKKGTRVGPVPQGVLGRAR